MFEELPFILGFIVLSIIAGTILTRVLPTPYNMILFGFAIVGTVLHEVCHIIMCFLTRTKIDHISLLKKVPTKKNDRFAIGGEVIPKDEQRLSFLKAFLIGLAPSYICFWVFWFLWDQIRNGGLDELTIFFYIIVMCSLVLGGAPSLRDLRSIGGAFKRDMYYSFYQVILVGISLLTVIAIVYSCNIQVVHEIIIYLFIAAGYALYRYSFMGLSVLWRKMQSRSSLIARTTVSSRKLTRRTHKPMKPENLGIEEPHW